MEGVDAVFGFHNMPFMPLGAVGSNPGTIMAGSATFNIVFEGRGGHAAMPQNNIDPTPPAAQFITAVQVRSGHVPPHLLDHLVAIPLYSISHALMA